MAGDPQDNQLLTHASLVAAILMPALYYATQLIAAPFYPGYSFAQQPASMLGASSSRQPWIFNAGIMLTGAVSIFGSFGLYKSLRVTSGVRLSRTIAFSVAYTGAMLVKSGIYPLPDRRHSGPVLFTLMIPPLLFVAFRSLPRSRGLRAYLLFSTLLLIAILPLMRGIIKIRSIQGGTLQRLLALATFVPVGVVSFYLLRREQRRMAQRGAQLADQTPSRKPS